jgi:hypothetical protein
VLLISSRMLTLWDPYFPKKERKTKKEPTNPSKTSKLEILLIELLLKLGRTTFTSW